MDSKELSRFEALYNLAIKNPDQNEVRNASVLIVKMIERHNLLGIIKGDIKYEAAIPKAQPANNYDRNEAWKKKNEQDKSDFKESFKTFSLKHISSFSIISRANYTVEYMVDYLEYQNYNYGQTIIGVPAIVEQALRDKIISADEVLNYTKYVRIYIDQEVKGNVLVGVRGRSGGYRLK